MSAEEIELDPGLEREKDERIKGGESSGKGKQLELVPELGLGLRRWLRLLGLLGLRLEFGLLGRRGRGQRDHGWEGRLELGRGERRRRGQALDGAKGKLGL